jgi:glycine/D-amino acid oxidase-like deaminating enzyme
MDLKSESPYFLLKHGLLKSYPSLQQNISTPIAIMGAGITGALLAWHLVHAGFDVIMVDRRHVAMGSTCASTSLLQYEIDTPLHKLSELVGEKNAVRSYQLCRQAIYDLADICTQLKTDVGFELRKSLQFASYKSHVKNLQSEYLLRKQYGFDVAWLDEKELRSKFSLEYPAGLYSADGASVDAYALTHALLADAATKGLNIYDNTNVEAIHYRKKQIELKTTAGHTITCQHLMIACGYESQRYLRKQVETIHSTYAIVSEQIAQTNFWCDNALVWETATPYMYMRVTSDNRILIGGFDDDFYNPVLRDRRVKQKAKQLGQKIQKLMPGIPFKTDFAWAGAFASTKDGLPYVGTVKELPNTWFALGFGGNGITFSQMAAKMITEKMQGKANKDLSIFSFDR